MKTTIALSILMLLPALLLAQPQEVIDAYNLNQAILSKNTDELKKLIKEGGDVNYQYNGRNALHTACDKGYTEMASLIVEAGADVNSYSEEGIGSSPLQIVCGDPMEDFSELAALLIANDADPNLTLNPDQAPLFVAIANAHAKSVKVLVEHGASTELKNSMDQSPLEHVNYLIERGVSDAERKANLQKINELLSK